MQEEDEKVCVSGCFFEVSYEVSVLEVVIWICL